MAYAAFSRRLFVLTGGGAVSGLSFASAARAQEAGSIRADFVDPIANAVAQAEAAELAFVGQYSLEQAEAAESGETAVDPELAEEFVNQCRETLSVVPSGETGRLISRVESDEIVQLLLSEGVSLTPTEHEFEIVREQIDSEEEDFIGVVVDIILRAFGLDRRVRLAMGAAIERLELGETFELLRRAIASGDWSNAERQLMVIVRRLFGRQGLFILADLLDGPAYQAVLRAIAARAVPFVGWAIFAVCLGIAIYENRDRLAAL